MFHVSCFVCSFSFIIKKAFLLRKVGWRSNDDCSRVTVEKTGMGASGLRSTIPISYFRIPALFIMKILAGIYDAKW